jgi:hypothetical protein
MLYPAVPELFKDSTHRINTVAKIVIQKESIFSNNSYIYVLNMNRQKSRWVYGNPVYFTFAKFKLADYMSMLGGNVKQPADRLNNLNNTFPVSLRYITSNGAHVFERPPFYNNFRYQPMKAFGASRTSRKPLEYNVWFPWSVYVFPLSAYGDKDDYPFADPYVFFSGSKLSSLDDTIYPAALPNVFSDARVCMGDSSSRIHGAWADMFQYKKPTYADAFNICINAFFSGGWNNDVLPTVTIPKVMRYNYYDQGNLAEEGEAKNREYSMRVTNSSRNSFANYLKLWSHMTLEEVLDAYSNEAYSPQYGNSLNHQISSNSIGGGSDAFGNIYKSNYNDPSDKIQYGSAEFLKTFTDSPIDNVSEPADEEYPQEHYYQILDNLISYYNLENTSQQVTAVNNDFTTTPF